MIHCSTFAFIESRRARRHTDKQKTTTEFPCVCACKKNTELNHAFTKMAKFKSHLTQLSVCLLMILEFHNKWLLFLGQHCVGFLNIHVHVYFRNFTRPYSCWDPVVTHTYIHTCTYIHTYIHTQTDYYNPPPTLGLINANAYPLLACWELLSWTDTILTPGTNAS